MQKNSPLLSKFICSLKLFRHGKNIEQFEAFFSADELKEAMGAAGVLEAPTVIILNEIDKG